MTPTAGFNTRASWTMRGQPATIRWTLHLAPYALRIRLRRVRYRPGWPG